MSTPTASAQRAEFQGTAIALRGNDIDTDRIIPARFLKSIVFEGLAEHVFADDRVALADAGKLHPFDDPAKRGASILLVGDNFGCGSSREHAPQAIHRWGIQAIVGESFAEIFFGNCISVGMPCVTLPPPQLADLMSRVDQDPSLQIKLDLRQRRLQVGVGAGQPRAITVSIPEGPRVAFVEGRWDSTAELLDGRDAAAQVAGRLPYLNGFAAATRTSGA